MIHSGVWIGAYGLSVSDVVSIVFVLIMVFVVAVVDDGSRIGDGSSDD